MAELRKTPQDGLELDPADADMSVNQPLGEMAIETGALFRQAMEQTRMAITIVDVHVPDTPIIYTNRAFTELTGYEREDAVGINCRFLQGVDTDPAAVRAIRAAVEEERVAVVEILNYRKDGSAFWNSLHVGPVYDEAGRLTHYYGSQWDVTDIVQKRRRIRLQDDVAEELQHRTRNLFNVIGAIVRLSGRDEPGAEAVVDKIVDRLTALSRAHEVSIAKSRGPGGTADLHEAVTTILGPYRTEEDRRIALSGEMVQLPPEAVTPLSLVLHELATNALKYGAFSVPDGAVTVSWTKAKGTLTLVWQEAGGPETEEPSALGMGSKIIDGVLRGVGAKLAADWRPGGLVATVTIRLDRDG